MAVSIEYAVRIETAEKQIAEKHLPFLFLFLSLRVSNLWMVTGARSGCIIARLCVHYCKALCPDERSLDGHSLFIVRLAL